MVIVPTKNGPSPLELSEAKLTMKCERSDTLDCELTGSYRIHNPTSAEIREELSVSFGGSAEILVDGAAVPLKDPRASGYHRVVAVPVELVVAAGATRTLVVRGRAHVWNHRRESGFLFPANSVRHLALANHRADEEYELQFQLDALRTWPGAPRVELEIDVPALFGVGGPMAREREGHYRLTTDKSENVDVTLYHSPVVYPGGVFAAIGGSTGDAKGLRLRLGGELAFRPWLLGSVAYETNAKGAHFVVPTVHAATPMIVFIPSLGAGLGMPVRFAPTTQVGVRLQFDLHLACFGFLTTIDMYPKTSTEPGLVQPSFLFQVSI
jgi:hypothetical protein